MQGLQLNLAGGHPVMVDPKPGLHAGVHDPQLPGPDIYAAVVELAAKGVTFERYDGFEQDEKGISRMGGGPAIAWFIDPAGNVMAVLEQP
jgi:hypothetical protein